MVTGGGRGIGAAYVRAFSDLGASVVIADMADEGEARAHELVTAGKRASFAKVDVTDAGNLGAAVAAAGGTVDVLVNNAAIYMALGGKQAFDQISRSLRRRAGRDLCHRPADLRGGLLHTLAASPYGARNSAIPLACSAA
jgi:NAD(P)-dependent dehydrogenase (short-subunit alcohol dehydrogenase family)